MTPVTCPACKPDAQCSACLAEELARRNQQHSLQKVCDLYNGTLTALGEDYAGTSARQADRLDRILKRGKGRPSKPKDELLVSLHVSVHPLFLDCLPAKGRGMAIEQAFGFTRPTTGRKP